MTLQYSFCEGLFPIQERRILEVRVRCLVPRRIYIEDKVPSNKIEKSTTGTVSIFQIFVPKFALIHCDSLSSRISSKVWPKPSSLAQDNETICSVPSSCFTPVADTLQLYVETPSVEKMAKNRT
mmetsp:Transcript_13180/g.20096  ORF Transcript_13180/g.20096 Transcript_13180/m.20096 type:complete len:124 (-) Transcript_13180:554-925(-)